MTGPHNLIEIEMIIKAHYMARFLPGTSEADRDALDRLLKADMVQFMADSCSITTTLRGQFWVEHLRTIPYPIERFTYSIPEVK